MPFADFDTAAVARALSQIADRPDDLADAYFERLEEVELPPEGESLGLRVRREEGLAVRLVRDGRTWLAARDGIGGRAFAKALRQVARVLPAASYPEPALPMARWSGDRPEAPELFDFPGAVTRAVRRRHVAFPTRLSVRRHRRHVQVVGPRLVPEPERESFYSVHVALPWGDYGTLLPALGAEEADRVAEVVSGWFRARGAGPAAAGPTTLVLAPAATAVLLHEAVAHALEADVLAIGGHPDAAVGVELAESGLDVLDDPGASPGETRRTTDDEGVAVRRRWLLRGGIVGEPLADARWARAAGDLSPGAARRGGRHHPPAPRSTHLELLPGELSRAELLEGADGGLWVPGASRGRLEPLTGRFTLEVPFARRIRSGAVTDPVAGFRIQGRVADLLTAVTGVGREVEAAGAGWCAKGGQKLPVWATAPALRLEGAEVRP